MTEKTDRTYKVEMFDRTLPPPGYYADSEGWGVPFSEEHGRESEQPANLAAAWAHYEREHDPPGMTMLGGFFCSPRTNPKASEARAAAWCRYWRCVDLIERLLRLAREERLLAEIETRRKPG